MTVTVTPEQAAALAEHVQAAQTAHARAQETLRILTLGLLPADAALTDVNCETGVLTFHVEDAPDAG